MFQQITKRDNAAAGTLATLELIYHLTVRQIRKSHRNAVVGLATEILQAVIFIAALYLMFSLLGARSSAIRGDFLLYLMTGICAFLAHIRALASISGAEGVTSSMMKHRSLNSVVIIVSAALASLYLQVLSVCVVLFGVHVLFHPLELHDPFSAMGVFILAWFSGACNGMLFRAIKPWYPSASNIIQMIYMRVNMIFSGKMFVANTLPAYMLPWFEWNPLFHAIDQIRGYIFINYFPRYTDWTYIIWFGLAVLVIGMLGENYSRKHASISLASRQ